MTCTANRARNHNKAKQRPDSPREAIFEEQPVERLVSNERLQRLAVAMEQLPTSSATRCSTRTAA